MDADITPLRFLQKAMWSNATPGRTAPEDYEQILPYTYYKPYGQPGEAEAIAHSGAARAVALKDQFGFDPELIAEVWRESIKLDRMQHVATGTRSAEEELP